MAVEQRIATCTSNLASARAETVSPTPLWRIWKAFVLSRFVTAAGTFRAARIFCIAEFGVSPWSMALISKVVSGVCTAADTGPPTFIRLSTGSPSPPAASTSRPPLLWLSGWPLASL